MNQLTSYGNTHTYCSLLNHTSDTAQSKTKVTTAIEKTSISIERCNHRDEYANQANKLQLQR
jgi:hypothetical protein